MSQPKSRRTRPLALSAAALAAASVLSPITATAAARPAATAPPRASAPAAPTAAPGPLSMEQATARARATHTAVAVTSMTTPISQTTANPDGSYTLTESAQPVRARRGSDWLPLDPTLHPQADGGIRPAVTTGDVVLSGGGDGPLATLSTGPRALSLRFPTKLPHPTLSGDTATYPGVYPGVDLIVTVSEQGGVSEVLKVANAAAAANPALAALRLGAAPTGLTGAADAAGNVRYTDSAGHTVYSMPAPTEWSSASARRAPIRTAVDASHLTMTADQTMLRSPATVYPAYLAASITFIPDSYGGTGYGWTEVDHNTDGSDPGLDGTDFWDETGDVKVGNNNGTALGWSGFYPPYFVARTYFQWNITALRGSNVKIKDATFSTLERYSPTCYLPSGDDHTVNIYAVSGTVGPGTTWINRPGMTTKIGSDSRLLGWSSACPAADISASIATPVTNSVAAGGNGMLTIGLEADDENDAYGWKAFDHRYTNISIHYDRQPSTPSNLSTSPTARCLSAAQTPYDVIGNSDITFNALTGKPDGVAKPLDITFTVKNAAGVNVPGSPDTIQTTAGSWANVTFPKSAFSSTSFSWSVSDTDGYMSSNTAGPCYFTVDDTQPAAPTVTSADGKYPQATTGAAVPTPGQFSFSAADAASFRWQLNDGPWTTVAATANAWTGSITPHHVGPNTLTVQAISVGGNYSQTYSYDFNTAKPVNPAPDGDLSGDGHPDLVLSGGGQTGAPPGLWYAPGDGAGHLGAAVDLGRAGNGTGTSVGSSNDFAGASVIHGDFHGTGIQDVLAYWPATSSAAAQAIVYEGTDDAAALTPTIFTNNVAVPANALYDGTNTPTQIANGGYVSKNTLPDLITVSSGDLWIAASNGTVGQYQSPYLLSTSPDAGTNDWDGYQITSVVDHTGATTLVFRSTATGAISEYPMSKLQAAWQAGTPITLGAADATAVTGLPATVPPAASSVMQGADINADGHADLWFVSASNAPGATTAALPFYPAGQPAGLGASQLDLATALADWPLTDGPGSTSFADPTDQHPAAITNAAKLSWPRDPVHGTVPKFDGSSTFAQAAGTGFDTSTSFTVSLWADVATSGSGTAFSMDGAHTSPFDIGLSNGAWTITTTSADAIQGTTFHFIAAPSAVSLNTWVHVTAEYDATQGTMTLFVDGTETASQNIGALWKSPGPVTIGTEGSNFLNGELADLEIYQTVRPARWVASAGLGPAAHQWKLDDGVDSAGVATNSTTAADAAGADPGTLSSGVSWAGDPTRGEVASFNGTNGAITLAGQTVPNGGAPFSISLWFKTTKAGEILLSSQSQPLGSSTTGADFDYFYVGTDGYLYGAYWASSGGTIKSSKTVTDGGWHHAVLASAAMTQTVYLDGVDIGETTTTTAMGETGHAFDYLGAGTSGDGWPALPNLTNLYFSGQMSDVRIWNEALSAGQAFTESPGEGATAWFSDGTRYSAVPNAVLHDCNNLTCVSFAPSQLTVSHAGTGAAMWSTTANTTSTGYLTLTPDGVLAIYGQPGGAALWSTTTSGNPGAVLVHQADGNLVLYTSSGHPLWATMTF